MRGVFRVLLSLGLAGISAGYFAAEKRVILADEGRVRTVTTFAPNVGSALVRLGVDIGPGDQVTPTASSSVRPVIEIKRAKPVLVVLNGVRRNVATTERTAGEILEALAIDTSGALVSPRLDDVVRAGDEIVVTQPAQVTVVDGGKTQPVITNSLTAGALFRELGLAVGPHDRVEPSIVAYPANGATIRIVRVSESIDRVHSPIGFRRVREKTDKLEYGVVKPGTGGQDGILAKSFRVTYEDGKVIHRVFIGKEVVREPVDEVTLVGTRRPVFIDHGGEQLASATWYSVAGLTAAHPSLPFGTVVRVTNLANGRHVDVVIRDRCACGIDLSNTAFSELAPLWKGRLNVKLEW